MSSNSITTELKIQPTFEQFIINLFDIKYLLHKYCRPYTEIFTTSFWSTEIRENIQLIAWPQHIDPEFHETPTPVSVLQRSLSARVEPRG